MHPSPLILLVPSPSLSPFGPPFLIVLHIAPRTRPLAASLSSLSLSPFGMLVLALLTPPPSPWHALLLALGSRFSWRPYRTYVQLSLHKQKIIQYGQKREALKGAKGQRCSWRPQEGPKRAPMLPIAIHIYRSLWSLWLSQGFAGSLGQKTIVPGRSASHPPGLPRDPPRAPAQGPRAPIRTASFIKPVDTLQRAEDMYICFKFAYTHN